MRMAGAAVGRIVLPRGAGGVGGVARRRNRSRRNDRRVSRGIRGCGSARLLRHDADGDAVGYRADAGADRADPARISGDAAGRVETGDGGSAPGAEGGALSVAAGVWGGVDGDAAGGTEGGARARLRPVGMPT